ncbi:MAG: hypothetical protein COA41_04215 [Sphingopyxis sp.]|nr:MAG: hypothetical protein COA41_04215 [Sphingopyxis sp.]
MTRNEVQEYLNKIDDLTREINQHVPDSGPSSTIFRADLAGLLVVSIASTYETCVKETLISYANGHHQAFGNFATNNFSKMNSKINIGDLHKYTKLCDSSISTKFKDGLKARKNLLYERIGKDIVEAYNQILSWRHDFAHAWIRNTTIEEAMSTHHLAKRVLYEFAQSFES